MSILFATYTAVFTHIAGNKMVLLRYYDKNDKELNINNPDVS